MWAIGRVGEQKPIMVCFDESIVKTLLMNFPLWSARMDKGAKEYVPSSLVRRKQGQWKMNSKSAYTDFTYP